MAIAIDVAIAVAIDRDKRLCLSWKVFLKNEMKGPVGRTVDTNCGILWNIRTIYLYMYMESCMSGSRRTRNDRNGPTARHICRDNIVMSLLTVPELAIVIPYTSRGCFGEERYYRHYRIHIHRLIHIHIYNHLQRQLTTQTHNETTIKKAPSVFLLWNAWRLLVFLSMTANYQYPHLPIPVRGIDRRNPCI